MRGFGRSALIAVALAAVTGTGALAAVPCGKTSAGFAAWLTDFKREAAAQGVSARTISAALDGIAYDPNVVALDRRQGVFSQGFLEFSDRMAAKYRIEQGRALIQKNRALFDRIEQQYGVPAPVIVAFWGLETDFGANMGDKPTLRSVATLAYDCRRPEMFRTQLMAALKIIDRGDLTPQSMRGPWAGELGSFQFLPDHYMNYGVDFDGDGRRDLLRSHPDALASAANYILALGWKRGQPWLEEVIVPPNLPWDQADLAIKLPRAQWAKWGVARAGGDALPPDQISASLLLPMGRNGPAFLAYANFDIYTEWNQSLVYATTAAYLATRIAGAGPVSRGRGVAPTLTMAQTAELQRLLDARGHHVGGVDGKLGAATRAAVKAEQKRLGMPADSYPTADLISRLKAGN